MSQLCVCVRDDMLTFFQASGCAVRRDCERHIAQTKSTSLACVCDAISRPIPPVGICVLYAL